MALQSYRLTIGALIDENNSGKNYVSEQPIYIKTKAGVLAPIFRDINGASEIFQDGLSNKTDSRGQFVFFVEQGDYIAEYQSQQTPISVFGADYFNSRIDESVTQITADVALSRGYNRKGTFASGFTYELANDVGIDANGDAWVYTNINALPAVVTASTVPSEPEYTPVVLSDAGSVSYSESGNVENALRKRAGYYTLAEAQASNLNLGQHIRITDRDSAIFKIESSGSPNGINLLDLGSGKAAALQQAGYSSAEQWGADKSKAGDSTPAINAYIKDTRTAKKSIGRGNFKLDSGLVVADTVEFEGTPQSILFPSTSFPADEDVLTINPVGTGNERLIKVSGLQIIPDAGSLARDAIVIDLTDASAILANFEMSRILTEETEGYALRLKNPTKLDGFFVSTIEKCKLKGGIFLERVGDSVNLVELTLSGTKEGVRATGIVGASQVIIEKTNITASGGAIYLQGFIEQCKMRDLQIEQSSPYNGSLPKGKRACVALIGNGTYVNDQSSIESSNVNSFSYADSCLHLEGVNGFVVRDNVLAVRTVGRPVAIGSFQSGSTVNLADEVLLDTSTGNYYLWDGALPKTVPSSSNPASTGGVGEGAWLLNADNNGSGTNTNYNQNHIVVRSSCRNVKIHADNTFLSSDTTVNTTPRILDLGVGTCGIHKPLTNLSNSWVATDSVNFPLTVFKDPSSNRVSISGAVSGGTTTAGTKILDLPAGFTPRDEPSLNTNIRKQVAYKGTASGVYGSAFIQVSNTGVVTMLEDIPSNATVYLDFEFAGDSVND